MKVIQKTNNAIMFGWSVYIPFAEAAMTHNRLFGARLLEDTQESIGGLNADDPKT